MAKFISVDFGDTTMDCVRFGRGKRNLIMIPGLGDGITTVKSASAGLAAAYGIFAKDFTVYMFSRKNKLAKGCTTEDMAKDLYCAMQKLNIDKACILGVSQGGMIAQHFAADYPNAVDKLVLAVTAPNCNEIVNTVVGNWIELAKAGEYKKIFIDTAEKSYSPKYLKHYRPLLPLISGLGVPRDQERFLVQANSCLTHDAQAKLAKIKCPTLVIGGACDKIVGAQASKELAACISNSELYMYREYGHAAYEEAKDFNSRVHSFLKN